MARSTYVYVVMSYLMSGQDGPLAAFTVKHELRTWLRSEKIDMHGVAVWRCSDGDHRDPVQMSVREVWGTSDEDPAQGSQAPGGSRGASPVSL